MTSSMPATGAPASPASPSSSSPPSNASDQTAAALRAIATAQGTVQGSKLFDIEDETVDGQRVWAAKVAAADGRQFNLVITQDGGQVLSNDEDPTPDDDVRKLRSATVGVEDAINTAATRAQGAGNLTSLEIDTTNNDTVVWQIEFGDDNGTTVLVDAASGEVLDVGPDVG